MFDAVRRPNRPVLDGVASVAIRVERGTVDAEHAFTVLRMHAVHECLHPPHFVIRRQAEQRLRPIIPGQRIGADVVFPKAETGGLDREAQSFLRSRNLCRIAEANGDADARHRVNTKIEGVAVAIE